MDILSLSRWVPASSFWLADLGSILAGVKPVEAELELHRQKMADQAMACLNEVAIELGKNKEKVLRQGLDLCQKQKPEWLGSLYLVCLEAARMEPTSIGKIAAQTRAQLPVAGWWSLFDPTWDGELVPLGRSSLSPSMDLQVRMALRLRMERAATGAELLGDLAELPELQRRDGERTLAAYLRRRSVAEMAPSESVADMPLRIQLMLCETPFLVRSLFHQEGPALGLKLGALRNRLLRVRALALQWRNLERPIRERRWETVGHVLSGLTSLPDESDLAPFRVGFLNVIKNPAPCLPPKDSPPWGMTAPTGHLLCKLIGPDPEGQRILRFLSVPGREHVRRMIAEPSILRKRPKWLPMADWEGFLQLCRGPFLEKLTTGLRLDHLRTLALGPFQKRARAFLPLLNQPLVQTTFRRNIHEPAVMRALIAGFEDDYATIAKSILAGWVETTADKTEHFQLLFASLSNVHRLQAFLSTLGRLPRNREVFFEALAEGNPAALKKPWITWLLGKTTRQTTDARAFLSSLLNGSPELQAWCITKGALGLEACKLLDPVVRIQILELGSNSKVRMPRSLRSTWRDWLEGVLAASDAGEALALHDHFPELGHAVQNQLAEVLPQAEPGVLLQALRRFPTLVQAWGGRLRGTHAKPPDGPDGQTVLALRAAYRPKQNWAFLAAISEPERDQAVATALTLLKAHPSRHAFLELGNCLGLRWLPTLAAATAACHEGSETTGARLDHLYRTYELPKKSGGSRLITVPPHWIKRLQRRINDVLLTPLGAHPCAHGFVRGRSIVTNAMGHVGKTVVVDCDIKAAFPSVSWRLVRFALNRDLGDRLSPKALFQLVDLCCYSGGLPIGAPTSPALLNRVLLVADQVLLAEAEHREVCYTRYADDLCFSGDARALELLPVARRMLASAGLALDPRKTNIYRRGRRQMVTGLVVNDQASTPRRLRRKLRAAVHRVEQGREPTWHGKPMNTQSLMGRLAFVKMVNQREGLRLVQRLKAALRAGR